MRITELMHEAHIDSQRELARAAGISNTAVSRIIRGERTRPKQDVLLRIAKALHADPFEILRIAGYAIPNLRMMYGTDEVIDSGIEVWRVEENGDIISAPVPPDVELRVRRLADRQGMSFNAMVVRLLEEALAKYSPQGG